MMNRVLCLWFPNWSVQRLRRAFPELHSGPLVLVQKHRGRQTVRACCFSAARRGVGPGMPLAEAEALLQSSSDAAAPRCVPEDPADDREALRRLAWDCEPFSPAVGIEESETPESLMLDITGCGACFGGEPQLAEQLRRRMREEGLEVRVGIAGTFGAAWGAAHYRTAPDRTASRREIVVLAEDQERSLRSLPVEALRLSGKVLPALQSLGIRTVGQLLSLPRQSLPSRFGPELLLRLDQALGGRQELIVPERRPEPLRESWETESTLRDVELLDSIVRGLLQRLAAPLERNRQGIKRLLCELFESGGTALRQSVELVNPSASTGHIMNLLRLQWERCSFPSGIRRVCLEVTQVEALAVRDRRLWGGRDGRQDPLPGQREIDGLIEILSSRLGRQAVLRPRLQAEHQPELAYRLVPCLETEGGRDEPLQGNEIPFRFTRPLWLKRRPVPVAVSAVGPGGSPLRLHWRGRNEPVAQAWGPERIMTGWWRAASFDSGFRAGDESRTEIRRDYFQVEFQNGRRFWLFHELETERWFLHAPFD